MAALVPTTFLLVALALLCWSFGRRIMIVAVRRRSVCGAGKCAGANASGASRRARRRERSFFLRSDDAADPSAIARAEPKKGRDQ